MEQEKKRPTRRPPEKRSSRAAQVAQRRREERAEKVRLETIRHKQTQKTKRRSKTKKRISRESLRRLLIMGGICVAVILSMIIFFRVRHVEVRGGSYYTPEEIIEAAETENGDNLLIISRGDIAGNIMAKCPYVSSVRVTRQLPDTVVIHIEEYDATYAVRDGSGDYYLITADGKATERITEAVAAEHIKIEDLTIRTPEIGAHVSVMTPQGQEIAAQGQLDALKAVLLAIEESQLLKQIASVSVPSSYEVSLWYTDRFKVELGDTSELSYKLNYLKNVVDTQKSYATGTIDLTESAEGKVYVTLNEE